MPANRAHTNTPFTFSATYNDCITGEVNEKKNALKGYSSEPYYPPPKHMKELQIVGGVFVLFELYFDKKTSGGKRVIFLSDFQGRDIYCTRAALSMALIFKYLKVSQYNGIRQTFSVARQTE